MEREDRWLLLIHQLPTTPAYLRVKVARRMAHIGAIALKNTVYVLPAGPATLEDFQWTVNEIRSGGGDANLFQARVITGLTDAELEHVFNEARNADYEAIASNVQALAASEHADPEDRASVARLRRRLSDVGAIDFFGAPQGHVASAAIEELVKRLAEEEIMTTHPVSAQYSNNIWVTRAGVHVDRMACAWLIRRFIDPNGEFRFVADREHRAGEREVCFDMLDGDFTHVGNRCTFEIMVERLLPIDPALRAIGEVVHDIDLKETKFDRPETPGIALLVNSIAMAHSDDEARIARASAAFDDVYVYYQRKERP